MAARLRPTLRCLQHDLGISPSNLPREVDLDVFEAHRMLETARNAINSGKDLERVRTHPEGVVWLEVEQKDPEWRGVVWQDDSDSDQFWLVAAGKHQEDGGNDFWDKLERASDLDKFQPTDDDRERIEDEGPARELARDCRTAKEMMLRATSMLGSVQSETLFGALVEVVAQDFGGGHDQVAVGITIRGPVREDLTVVLLRALVPGSSTDLDDGDWWPIEQGSEPVAGEEVWESVWDHDRLVRSCM